MSSSPTIESIHTLLTDVALDVKELKATKVDATIHQKDVDIIELKITSIEKSVEAIRGYAKIFTTTIIVALVSAVLQTIISNH